VIVAAWNVSLFYRKEGIRSSSVPGERAPGAMPATRPGWLLDLLPKRLGHECGGLEVVEVEDEGVVGGGVARCAFYGHCAVLGMLRDVPPLHSIDGRLLAKRKLGSRSVLLLGDSLSPYRALV
jgi:hypothetical protein